MNIYNPGEQIFLFATFNNDLNSISFINEPIVEILFIKDNKTITILQEKMNTNDYVSFFYNYNLPIDLEYGQYQIIYTGYSNGKENKIFENFFIVNNLKNNNPIRLYGYIYDSKNHKSLTDVEIQIVNLDDNTNYYTINNLIGQWECYVYSGNYKFIFKRKNYKTEQVEAKINDTLQEIEFNNVVMNEITNFKTGDGIYEVKEQYVLKNGQPIENLSIKICDVNDMNNLLIDTITDSNGNWIAYLNEGLYFMNVVGEFNKKKYDKKFRLKIKNNGEYKFEDISNNISNECTVSYPNGNGMYKYIDYLYDKNNKPLCDVQVNILEGDNIKYQYYSNLEGKFEFNLDIGDYTFEFYHPSFKTIVKKISITEDYIGEQIKEE